MREPEEYTKEAAFFVAQMVQAGMSDDQAFNSQVTSAIRAAMMQAWIMGAVAAGMRESMAQDRAAKVMGYD